jgi:hypothetical protein
MHHKIESTANNNQIVDYDIFRISYSGYLDTKIIADFLNKQNELAYSLNNSRIPIELQLSLGMTANCFNKRFIKNIHDMFIRSIGYFIHSQDVKVNAKTNIRKILECAAMTYGGRSSFEYLEIIKYLKERIHNFLLNVAFCRVSLFRSEYAVVSKEEQTIFNASDCAELIYGADFTHFKNLIKEKISFIIWETALEKRAPLTFPGFYDLHFVNTGLLWLRKYISRHEYLNNKYINFYCNRILEGIDIVQNHILTEFKKTVAEKLNPDDSFTLFGSKKKLPLPLQELFSKILADFREMERGSVDFPPLDPITQITYILRLVEEKYDELIKNDPESAWMMKEFLKTNRALRNEVHVKGKYVFEEILDFNGSIVCHLSPNMKEAQRFLNLVNKASITQLDDYLKFKNHTHAETAAVGAKMKNSG